MTNRNYWVKVIALKKQRRVFYRAYGNIFDRRVYAHAAYLRVASGDIIGISYMASHPETKEMIMRHDVFYDRFTARSLRLSGLVIKWDEVLKIPKERR